MKGGRGDGGGTGFGTVEPGVVGGGGEHVRPTAARIMSKANGRGGKGVRGLNRGKNPGRTGGGAESRKKKKRGSYQTFNGEKRGFTSVNLGLGMIKPKKNKRGGRLGGGTNFFSGLYRLIGPYRKGGAKKGENTKPGSRGENQGGETITKTGQEKRGLTKKPKKK